MTPEFRLLCISLRRPLGAGETEEIRGVIAAGPYWTAVVEGAARHRAAPFLLHALEACACEGVPPDVIASLRQKTVRSARDIDFFADPERFAEAEAVLAAAGYRSRSKDTSPGRRAVYRRHIKEVEYVHPGHKTLVELHHRLTDNPSLLPSDFERLWSGREEVQLAQRAVPTLPRTYLALYLCAHGANHAWQRLRWLADFAEELKLSGNADATLAAARIGGLEAATLHALRLAHDWLGLPLSERHLAAAREDNHVRRLDRIFSRISGHPCWLQPLPLPTFATVWPRLYAFMLKTNARYWANQVKRAWFTPDDWDLIRLPDPLLWLQHLVRPFGWILRRTPWPSFQRRGRASLVRQR